MRDQKDEGNVITQSLCIGNDCICTVPNVITVGSTVSKVRWRDIKTYLSHCVLEMTEVGTEHSYSSYIYCEGL